MTDHHYESSDAPFTPADEAAMLADEQGEAWSAWRDYADQPIAKRGGAAVVTDEVARFYCRGREAS